MGDVQLVNLPFAHLTWYNRPRRNWRRCLCKICIGNSMICSDIWHKYHERYFEIVLIYEISRAVRWNLRQFWNITSVIYARHHVQIMLLFVYTTAHKRVVIFTCRFFKLSWNTTALSQSSCRNFCCSSIMVGKPCCANGEYVLVSI